MTTEKQNVIVEQGKSEYRIVIPQHAEAPLRNAAHEVQASIALATGATLPLCSDEGELPGRVISLGATKQAREAGITTEGLEDEGFRIATKEGCVYIIGPDTPEGGWAKAGGVSTGTANGVYYFLERYLDVRWLMPGELGRDVPSRSRFAIPDIIDYRENPRMLFRQLPYLQGERPAVQQWMECQKLRYYSMNFEGHHNWGWVLNDKELMDRHPEWLPMINGERTAPPHGQQSHWKLETTNPELVRYFADKAIETIKNSERPRMFSLSPNDGMHWSESPESQALYDPSRPKIYDEEAPDDKPGVSSLVLKWYHDVAEIVAKQLPEARLGGFIYAHYLYPPTKLEVKLPDNFIPMVAPSFDYGYALYRKEVQKQFQIVMDGWAQTAQSLIYYDIPNVMLGMKRPGRWRDQPGTTGIVTPPATGILNFVFANLVKNQVRGARIYGAVSWSNAALSNYIVAKMMWDPTLNAEALQQEWLQRAYGPGAGAIMEVFYEKLDQYYDDCFNQSVRLKYLVDDYLMKTVYADHYPELEALLLQAKRQPMTDEQRKRLELIEDNLIVLQWRLRNAGLWPTSAKSKLERSREEVLSVLNASHADFDRFPQFQLDVKQARGIAADALQYKVRLHDGERKPLTRTPHWDQRVLLFYPMSDGEVRITPRSVCHGLFIAGYRLLDAQGQVIRDGVIDTGFPFQLPVKAHQPYFLYLPERFEVSQLLAIENAAVAQAVDLEGDTLILRGNSAAPLYVYSGGRDDVRLTELGTTVEIQL